MQESLSANIKYYYCLKKATEINDLLSYQKLFLDGEFNFQGQ